MAFLAGAVDDAMQVRAVDVVGPALKQVADVDHQGAGNERRADPLAVALAQFEPADRILRQQRDHAVVGIRRDPERLVVGHRRLWRVVEQPHLHHRLVAGTQEIVGRHVEADREHPQQALAEREQFLKIGPGGFAQPRTVRRRPAVGAVQRPCRNHVRVGQRQLGRRSHSSP